MSQASEQIDQLWSSLVKYSTVANGTALALSLVTVGKLFGEIDPVAPAKFPIWCFFFSLLASGLHLVTSYFHKLWSAKESLRGKALILAEKIKCAQAKALSNGIVNEKDTEFSELGEVLKQTADDLNHPAFFVPDRGVERLRNAQELFFWASHLLFFVGVFLIIWSI
ncbi:hypothetical protein [Roseibium album]|uniref:hypothetical protein n=1 Tax=Roseibium album TaxID=311410 RepID=UPI003BAEF91A